jgi:hypothetical protein
VHRAAERERALAGLAVDGLAQAEHPLGVEAVAAARVELQRGVRQVGRRHRLGRAHLVSEWRPAAHRLGLLRPDPPLDGEELAPDPGRRPHEPDGELARVAGVDPRERPSRGDAGARAEPVIAELGGGARQRRLAQLESLLAHANPQAEHQPQEHGGPGGRRPLLRAALERGRVEDAAQDQTPLGAGGGDISEPAVLGGLLFARLRREALQLE